MQEAENQLPLNLPQIILSIQNEYIVKQVLSNMNNGRQKYFLVSKGNQLYVALISTRPQQIQKQAQFLLRLGDNPYTVKYIHHNINGKVIARNGDQLNQINVAVLITEYFQHGDVLEFLMSNMKLYNNINERFRIPLSICKNIFYQILQGLRYIHSKQIFHRDVKLQNLYFDENFDVKFISFGLSSNISERQLNGRAIGTQGYRAPQVQRGIIFDQKSDIFASGVCFFSLYYLSQPFLSSNGHHYDIFSSQAAHNRRMQRWQFYKNRQNIDTPIQMKLLFSKIFLNDSNLRPNIQQIEISHLFENMATLQQTRNYLRRQFQICVQRNQQFGNRINRIRAIINQINQL